MDSKNKSTGDPILDEILSDDYVSEFDDIAIPDDDEIDWIPSKRYKRRMNRLFRKALSNGFIPYREVDNAYERVRSYLIARFGPPDKF